MKRKVKILLTAFEPFGGNSINASREAAALVTAPEDVELVRAVLPVTYGEADRALRELIGAERPDAVLCTGVAGGNSRIAVERVAVNLRDCARPDNAGVILEDVPIRKDGPAAYFATLPVKRIVRAIDEKGIPVALSNSAGTYLCNNVMYRALEACSAGAVPVPAGFIHLPAAPGEYPDRPDIPTLASGTAAQALETALRVITETVAG